MRNDETITRIYNSTLQLPSVPPLFIAVGGGGLASGIALVLPDTPLYLVEPEGKNLRQQVSF